MTVTAPPRPPRPPQRRDPVEHPDPEALIEEARQRTRRRRRAYAAAAAGLALLGVSLAVVFGRPETSQSASPEPNVLRVASDDEPATIVAHYGKFHEGWAIVYDDGRVIAHSDLSTTGWTLSMYERRLTAEGLDRVRSGAVPASAFVREFFPGNALSYWEPFPPSGELPPGFAATPKLAADTWSDPGFKTYVASRYAFCNFGRLTEGLRGLGRLPAAVQALVRGKEKTYTNYHIVYGDSVTPLECFEVSAAEARVIEGIPSDAPSFGLVPVLPHGEPIYFPG